MIDSFSIKSGLPLSLNNDKKEVSEKKKEIRSKLKKLNLGCNEILECNFIAKEIRSNSDIENLLIYNIGLSSFKPLIINGVILRYIRDFKRDKTIIYEYKIIKNTFFTNSEPLFVEKICMEATTNRFDYFIKLREKMKEKNFENNSTISSDASIVINIKTNSLFNFNLSKKIKPMLDGFISALHKKIFFNSSEEMEEVYDLYRKSLKKYIFEETVEKDLIFGEYRRGILPAHKTITVVKNKNKSLRLSPQDNIFKNIEIHVVESSEVFETEFSISVFKSLF